MPLKPGHTRYRGVVMLSLDADELRKQNRRLRSLLRQKRAADAEEVYLHMLSLAGASVEVRQAIEDEWKAELAIKERCGSQEDRKEDPTKFWTIHRA